MANIALTSNVVVRAGLADPVGQSITSSDTAKLTNTGKEYIRVANASGAGRVLTIQTPNVDADGNAVADLTPASIANSTTKWFGPFPTGVYNDSAGVVNIVPDGTVTITAFQLPFTN